MPSVIRVNTWEECETKIDEIKKKHDSLTGICFRGQSNSEWPLDTTLGRNVGCEYRVDEYYRLIWGIKPEIETFTGSAWETPDPKKVAEWTSCYDFSRKLAFVEEELAYSYLAYLRHHGFPSPILDWSSSPYIAAYFAFAQAQRSAHVAIYVFVESPNNLKVRGSDGPSIYGVGPNIKTHKRHFRQQSRYTICAEYHCSKTWKFVPHQRVLDAGSSDQDLLWKIEIPASERGEVLRYLDKLNLNAYSLFNSEESLMETLAFRETDRMLRNCQGAPNIAASPAQQRSLPSKSHVSIMS
jgi:hypothetical protein